MWIANCFGSNAFAAYETHAEAERMAVELFGDRADNDCSFGEVKSVDEFRAWHTNELEMADNDAEYATAMRNAIDAIDRAVAAPGTVVNA